jgi:hypothetical protein
MQNLIAEGVDLETLRSRVPKNERGATMSIGSIGHHEGRCRGPCLLEMTYCPNKIDCAFCHFLSKPRQSRDRRGINPPKAVRESYLKLEEELKTMIDMDPLGFDVDSIELPEMDCKSSNKMMRRLKAYQDAVVARRRDAS